MENLVQAPSAAEQDYLKHIFSLEQDVGRATTQALAMRMGVKPASVTAMVKRLAEDAGGPYVTHTPYHGVALTPRGRAVALEMVRHHRLIELFLSTVLDVPWDRVHAEAERLEHYISEDIEERIAAKLGYPAYDPHGDPIPTREGALPSSNFVPLTSIGGLGAATVMRVPNGDPALLQYLASLLLIPGALVTLDNVAPYGDVFTIRIGTAVHSLGGAIARRILVQPLTPPEYDEARTPEPQRISETATR